MDLDLTSIEAHNNSKEKGFYESFLLIEMLKRKNLIKDNEYKLLQSQLINSNLMLIITEIAEMAEELRKDDYNSFKEELSDVFIRLLDLTGYLYYAELIDKDIQKAILKKMETNKNRPFKHGKLF